MELVYLLFIFLKKSTVQMLDVMELVLSQHFQAWCVTVHVGPKKKEKKREAETPDLDALDMIQTGINDSSGLRGSEEK